jgi:hypothetical protein
MTNPAPEELLAQAHKVVDAWNNLELDVLHDLVDENIVVVHQNRGVAATGRDLMIETVKQMKQVFPDRSIGETTRWAVTGNSVLRETTWQGTATADVPGFGKAGELCKLNVLSIMTFEDGRLTEWCDYG